jgi:phage FluMu protein Com
MTAVHCACGRLLGRFEGKYDIRCRCKRIVKGDTTEKPTLLDEVRMFHRRKTPRTMMPVR